MRPVLFRSLHSTADSATAVICSPDEMDKILVPVAVSASSPVHIGVDVVVAAMVTAESDVVDDDDVDSAVAATALVLQPNTMYMIN